MDAFIRANSAFLGSTLYLIVALLLAGYSIRYTQIEANYQAMSTAVNQLNAQTKKLKEKHQLQLEQQQSANKAEQGVSKMPVFLGQMNKIAKHNGVVVRSLVPDAQNKQKFTLEFIDTYATFLRFAAQLESFDTIINDMEVRPYDNSVTPPKHLVRFSITPRNNAQELDNKRTDLLQAEVRKDVRNPFQRFAINPGATRQRGAIDLTWILKLTGIGKEGGEPYATIDRIRYNVGDSIRNKVITRITNKRVYLHESSANGERDFVLKFRTKSNKVR